MHQGELFAVGCTGRWKALQNRSMGFRVLEPSNTECRILCLSLLFLCAQIVHSFHRTVTRSMDQVRKVLSRRKFRKGLVRKSGSLPFVARNIELKSYSVLKQRTRKLKISCRYRLIKNTYLSKN